ncbi:MAG: hypothetical protein Q8M24_05130 [Pseudolabrys sp.]|nr:hypothetical protein [Pseudolabrys sp.]MDP2294829.1 hypothetical protein [Pseudolabrys sp.]
MSIHAPEEPLSSRNLVITRDAETVSLHYEIPWSMTLGSKSHEKDLRRRFKARLQRWLPVNIHDAGNVISATWIAKDLENVRSAVQYLDHMLEGFRKERLIPKIVEEALGISSVERKRWIKDGRLSTSGAGHFLKGKTRFQFSMHAPDDIARIAANPEIISAWRQQDGEPS